jgi:hypothetical protein
MSSLSSAVRSAVLWLVPFALLALALAWQTDWGRAFARTPAAEAPPPAQPLSLALLPEYAATATPEKNRDAVDRTLFNPTRRPAPTAVVEVAKPKMQRGQFTLAGTIVVDGKTTAFLREVSGGKPRRVVQGESINGLTVTQIGPDRVKLTLGDESEDLLLKVAAGPRTTIQPVVPSAPVTAGGAGSPAQPGQGGPMQAGGVPGGPRDVADVLAERRRAARAAEAAAVGQVPGTSVAPGPGGPIAAPTMPPVPTVDPRAGDPRWESVYQRYQQPRGR